MDRRIDRFDRVFWRRLLRLVRPFWTSDQKWRGYRLFTTLIAVGALAIGLAAYATYINRDLTNAIQAHDRARFWAQIEKFAVYAIVFIPITAYFPWINSRLNIVWREWMTEHMLAKSFAHRAFYNIVASGRIDNPDQRISEDIGSFTGTTLSMILTILNSPITGTTFFLILWSISPKLALFLLFYALIGTWASIVVGRRLISIRFDQQRYEADFRFGLVHFRDNAEPIAMYGGEDYERKQLLGRFANVVDNYNLLIKWIRHLGFVTASYNGPADLLPWFLLAGDYFAGRITFGQLNQAALAFGALKGAISFVVDKFGDIANYATVVNRLAEFDEQCEAAAGAGELDGAKRIETEEDSRLALEDLTVETPDRQRTIVRDLSLAMDQGGRVLVRGESGVGKTSLLRAIAGLWTAGSGRIVRPAPRDAMFLPQRPYLVLGTLRDQLCFPHASGTPDEQLMQALGDANLADLPVRAGGLDAERDWPDFLSPGEQQRLAFARLLIHRPSFAFVDEATSALDAANERLIYERLSAMKLSLLSVGHREALVKFHDRVLDIKSDSTWRLGLAHDADATEVPLR